MYDAGKVSIGLIVFVGIATFGFWYNALFGQPDHKPQPDTPKKEKQCVADREYMRTSHMNLLNQWRDSAVRKGERIYTAPSGVKYDKSLSNTCMSANCHSSRKHFCAECHEYAGVELFCWDCHVIPEENE